MASVNKVILIGNLGKDPEVRYTPSGTAVVNISIATTRNWKNKDSGDKMEETEWHRITAYDRLAEIIGEYLRKGSSVYIEGRLKTRKYEDKDKVERYVTEVIAEEMRMLGSRDRDGGNQGGGEPQQRTQPQSRGSQAPQQRSGQTQQRQQPQRQQGGGGSSGFDDMDDDIPF